MRINVSQNDKLLGQRAAEQAADVLKEAIATKGNARLILATGASQFTTLEALLTHDLDWSKVELFNLDEYIGIDSNHPASFVKYLTDRIVSKVNFKSVNLVDPSIGVSEIIEKLSKEIERDDIDLCILGIGENSHVAFNDPPADFDTKESFIVVELDEACRNQQLREGWFPTFEDVPTQAITMTIHRILQSKTIVAAIPYEVKAVAVKKSFENEVTPLIPATILKNHPNITFYLDEDSASLIDVEAYQ